VVFTLGSSKIGIVTIALMNQIKIVYDRISMNLENCETEKKLRQVFKVWLRIIIVCVFDLIN